MLADADAGYGGSFPTSPLPLVTGSAITAMPTGGPAAQVVMMSGANGLPSIARSVPPTIGPASLQPLPPVESGPVSLPPKLTAAPVLANERDEHQATIVVGPGRPPDSDEEIITDSKNPTGLPDQVLRSPPRSAPRQPSGPRRQSRLVSPAPPRVLGDSQPLPTPLANRAPSQAQLGAPPGNTRLLIALGGIVALLVVGLVAAVLLRPPPTGLVIINVPEEVRGQVQVELNGEPVREKGGGPLKDWPQVRSVRVGKATVRLTAPGYESVFEIVEVRESEPAELKKELKRSTH